MTRFSVAAVCSLLMVGGTAFAQTPAPPPAAAVPPPQTQAPLRMAFLDLQRVAAESAEGKVASGKVQRTLSVSDQPKAAIGSQRDRDDRAADNETHTTVPMRPDVMPQRGVVPVQ